MKSPALNSSRLCSDFFFLKSVRIILFGFHWIPMAFEMLCHKFCLDFKGNHFVVVVSLIPSAIHLCCGGVMKLN